jgi:hypothetical protein
MTKVMLNYRSNGRRRLGSPSSRLLDGAETGPTRLNSWRMMTTVRGKKINFALEQVMKAQGQSRGIPLIFLNLGARWGWLFNATPNPLYFRGRDVVSFVQWAGWCWGAVWTGAESISFTGIPSPDRPIRSSPVPAIQLWERQISYSKLFFIPMPPHFPYGLRGLPSRLWPKCNRLLRLGSPWGAVTLYRWGGWWYMNMKYQDGP